MCRRGFNYSDVLKGLVRTSASGKLFRRYTRGVSEHYEISYMYIVWDRTVFKLLFIIKYNILELHQNSNVGKYLPINFHSCKVK